MMRATSYQPLKAGLALFSLAFALVVTLTPSPAMAQPGGITTNGTVTDAQIGLGPGFLFEPEVPLSSLKTVPIWNELEQLLDNPYRVALCSSLLTAPPLVQTTPGTTQITGSPTAEIYPAYCSNGVERRPAFGVALPPLLVHPLNYNPTDGEEMRLLNPGYPGTDWSVPDQLIQCSTVDPVNEVNRDLVAGCDGDRDVNQVTINGIVVVHTGPFDPNRWVWTYKTVPVSPGTARVTAAEIDYNAPVLPDPGLSPLTPASFICEITTEVVPPEGSTICGGDPGEPNYFGFGVNAAAGYSNPAVPGGIFNPTTHMVSDITGLPLFDPTRGTITPRNSSGAGGLRKPSLRVPPYGSPTVPGYLANTDPNNVAPSNENDYIRDRRVAAELGKALFWDMQVGSDSVQSCGSCHAHAAADNRTKNQMNPNDIGGDNFFEVGQASPTLLGANHNLVLSDFPLHKLGNPEIAGDPKCGAGITATVDPGVLENTPPGGLSGTVCAASNTLNPRAHNPDNTAADGTPQNDVASSMGVHFGMFRDIAPIGSFAPPSIRVRSLLPDLRSTTPAANIDPIPGFAGASGNEFRRVEPRNTPTINAAALNFDNFWDGRARHDFNGGSVFGAADPQRHVFVGNGSRNGNLTATRQIIRFVSIASLATGPALSKFEMSFDGRNWAKIGKKMLQLGMTPLANQLVATDDSVLGRWSNQGGSSCGSLGFFERSGPFLNPSGTPGNPLQGGKPGLCINYRALIARAFYPQLHNNLSRHMNGCYTDGRTPTDPLTPNCLPGTFDDPFDHFVLSDPMPGLADLGDTNQFTQMDANFSLFWGLSIHAWATILMPDNTPYDQFLDQNPDQFESIGEVGEPGLVGPLPVCTSATQRHCFREIGNFKRDSSFANPNVNNCMFPATGEGQTQLVLVSPCLGSRNPQSNDPDPLLGMDIFQGSNLSLKNPNFRAARCGECHAGPTLTDNTMPFTFKAQLGDFIGEFLSAGNEALIEPLGRPRVISGFLLESEFNENGQDAIERRLINQSIVPCPTGATRGGLAFPGGLEPGPDAVGFGLCSGADQAFFDNGVYNLGVTPCEANQSGVTGRCDDVGRGANDAFGWPMSLAALLLKNLGGISTEPGSALMTFDPSLGGGGGLFEETAQDQQINPGESGEAIAPKLPPYLAPFANEINVGDSMPELDELHGGLNTLTDTAMLEGFIDIIGPFNPAGVLNESYNNGEGPEMGTWPFVNRVGRFGSIKAPQLREVELTGPYFHNGGKLTLRQVVDFYVRGGDFPLTNATHRDFNIVNQNFEKQSNLTEAEKVALVDFLLELTDDRVRFERGPFDHPEVILPLDGTAPENTGGRAGTFQVSSCVATANSTSLGPGAKECAGGMFLDVPATGNAGNSGPIPNFLGIMGMDPVTHKPIKRLVGSAAFCATVDSQYCH